MIDRCYQLNNKDYLHYGGRGIFVAPEWRERPEGFLEFLSWYKSQPEWENRALEIDRENNNGPYTPENCKLKTHKDNCNNRRSSKSVLVFGEKLTYSQAISKYGKVSRSLFIRRLSKGWNPEDALLTPANPPGPIPKVVVMDINK